MTPRDLIRSSFRLLGINPSGENPTDIEEQDSLLAFNAMLNGWIHKGIDLEYLSVTDPSAPLEYPEDHYDAFRYNLAVHIAPEYGKQIPPAVLGIAADTFKALQVAYSDPDTLEVDHALTLRPIWWP